MVGEGVEGGRRGGSSWWVRVWRERGEAEALGG